MMTIVMGSIGEFCLRLVRGAGKIAGTGSRAVKSGSDAVKLSLDKIKPQSNIEKIRAIVLEELSAANIGQSGNKEEIEKRISSLSKTILQLQKELNELGDNRSVSQSIKENKSINTEDKAILSRIFQHNIALQKKGQ